MKRKARKTWNSWMFRCFGLHYMVWGVTLTMAALSDTMLELVLFWRSTRSFRSKIYKWWNDSDAAKGINKMYLYNSS